MRAGGFIPLPLAGALAAGAIILVMGIGLKIQTSRLHAVQDEFSAFKTKTKAEGDAAKVDAKRQMDERTSASKQREQENAKRYADLDARYADARRRLRDRDPGGGEAKPLSAAAGIAHCPGGQADIAGGLDRLEGGILALLERGDRAITRTETCRAWIADQMTVK